MRLVSSFQFNDFQRDIFLFCQNTQQSIDVIIRIGTTIGIISDQPLFIRAFSGFNPDFPIDIGKGFNVSFSNGIPLENAMAGY